MNEISETMLLQYSEGLLDTRESALVELELQRQPALRDQLAAFMATRSDAEIWRVYDQPMQEPVPRHLIDFVMSAPLGTAARPAPRAATSVWNSIQHRIRGMLLPQDGFWAPAFSYAAALAVGISLGWYLHSGATPGTGRDVASLQAQDGLRADAGLSVILETHASGTAEGTPLHPGSAWRATPVLTFRSHDGAYCRQYEMNQPGATKAFAGVACRSGGGQWLVQTHTTMTASGKVPDPTSVRPADGPGSDRSAVDRAVTGLMDGDALGVSEEKQLLTSGWGASRK